MRRLLMPQDWLQSTEEAEREVLPKRFKELFEQMMTAKLVDLQRESSLQFSRAHDQLVRQGGVSPSSTARLHNQLNVDLVKKIVSAVVHSQREIITSLATPFSDTLATELKHQLKTYVSPKWSEALYKLKVSNISKQHASRLKEEVTVNRSFFLKRAEAEIDFLVDSLRKKKTPGLRVTAKKWPSGGSSRKRFTA